MMDEDSTLRKMAQYDFNKPINATIIFEESDEENDSWDLFSLNLQKQSANQTNLCNTTNVSTSKIMEEPSYPIKDPKITVPVNKNKRKNNLKESKPPSYENNNNNQYKCTQVNSLQYVENLSGQNSHQLAPNKDFSILYSSSEKNSATYGLKNTNTGDKIVENRMSSYLKDLLITVSENLLTILKAYSYYMQTKNSASTMATIEKALKYFLRIKYHFFNLSYSTLIILFLPEHKNGSFDENFLVHTLRIAHNKGFYCSYQQLEGIYSEMMEWLVINKQKLDEMPLHNIHDHKSLLIQELKKPVKSYKKSRFTKIHKTPHPSYREPNLKNILSIGPPGREVQININQSYIQSLPNDSNIGYSTNINNSCRHSHPSSQNENSSNINNYNQLLSTQRNLTPTHGTNGTGPLNYGSHLFDIGTDRLTEMYPIEYQRQLTTDKTNIRSSVSRDSGFISPLNFNSTTEHTFDMDVEERHKSDPQMVPLITYVTSLNPNATYIKNGTCQTCGKNTNTKCMRCQKTYYCGLLCQTIDWTHHMNICKNTTTNTNLQNNVEKAL